MKTRLWLGVGAFVLAGAVVPVTRTDDANASPRTGTIKIPARAIPIAEAGEGGEGGGAPAFYSLTSSDPNAYSYDAEPVINAYVDLVRDSYAKAAGDAAAMNAAINAFLANPDQNSLDSARKAWIAARPAYLVTEAFRFYDGPIDAIEGQINAWPMNEAAIDYVEGDAKAGLVNSMDMALTEDLLLSSNQANDEAEVTTGWHAVEFLLWGQDLSPDGPGARPASDYVAGTPSNDRRRLFLQLAAARLETDLKGLHDAWTTSDGEAYSAKFLGLPLREAIGRMLNGVAILAGFEFMSERMAVALDSGDQEDEHSCFSDTTHQDFVHDLAGIKAVWTGNGVGKDRPGLDDLLRSLDPALAGDIDTLVANAEARIAALGNPWDQVLAAEPGSPERQAGEQAVASLQALGDGFRKAGAKLGVLVLIPAG